MQRKLNLTLHWLGRKGGNNSVLTLNLSNISLIYRKHKTSKPSGVEKILSWEKLRVNTRFYFPILLHFFLFHLGLGEVYRIEKKKNQGLVLSVTDRPGKFVKSFFFPPKIKKSSSLLSWFCPLFFPVSSMDCKVGQ